MVDRSLQIREINVHWFGRLISAEVDTPLMNHGAVDFERERVADNLQPGSALAGLAFVFFRSIDEIQFRLVNHHTPHHPAVNQRVPLDSEIQSFGGKKRDRDVAGRLANTYIAD